MTNSTLAHPAKNYIPLTFLSVIALEDDDIELIHNLEINSYMKQDFDLLYAIRKVWNKQQSMRSLKCKPRGEELKTNLILVSDASAEFVTYTSTLISMGPSIFDEASEIIENIKKYKLIVDMIVSDVFYKISGFDGTIAHEANWLEKIKELKTSLASIIRLLVTKPKEGELYIQDCLIVATDVASLIAPRARSAAEDMLPARSGPIGDAEFNALISELSIVFTQATGLKATCYYSNIHSKRGRFFTFIIECCMLFDIPYHSEVALAKRVQRVIRSYN